MEQATFAGGCFWCTEALFTKLKGVHDVIPGYTGGHLHNPTYQQVCTGNTGHTEAIELSFDPTVISYKTLLEVFFATHDPTTPNKQGNDVGTQYRSAIFYHSDKQKKEANDYIHLLATEKKYTSEIVTEVIPATTFYPAEDYHKQYFQKNSSQPYCQIIIDPKIQKLLQHYRYLVY